MIVVEEHCQAGTEGIGTNCGALCKLLLNQQAWCWGQDIRRADGNLLLAFGLQRCRADRPGRGSSRYALEWMGKAHVILWGHGVFFGVAGVGGLYLPRFSAVPWRTAYADLPASCWAAEDLYDLHAARMPVERRSTSYMLRCLLRWIAGYESWVLGSYGLPYRRLSLAGWHRPQVPPERVPGLWRRLAAHASRCIAESLPAERQNSACYPQQHRV